MNTNRRLSIFSGSSKATATTLVFRRFMGALSLSAFVVSVAFYVGSFRGLTMDNLGDWLSYLSDTMFLLILPIFVIEYSTLRKQPFDWKRFSEGIPEWALFTIKFLGWFAIIHFVLFLLLSHMAAPEIIDGRYVLNDHGQISKFLTEAEYRSLKGSELRIFVTLWIFVYFTVGMYWLFHDGKKQHLRRSPIEDQE